MIHLYEIEEDGYDTTRITPGAGWVVGHEVHCCIRYGRSEILEGPLCQCGHSDLRVLAWPAPAGVGVMCLVEDGVLLVPDGPCPNQEDEWCGNCGNTREHHQPIGDRPEDAPIREAWERLCATEPVREDGAQPHLDCLYLYVEGALHRVEDVTEAWRAEMRGFNDLCSMMSGDFPEAQALRIDAPGKEAVWIDAGLLTPYKERT